MNHLYDTHCLNILPVIDQAYNMNNMYNKSQTCKQTWLKKCNIKCIMNQISNKILIYAYNVCQYSAFSCCESQAFFRRVGLVFGLPCASSEILNILSILCCCGVFYQVSVTSYRRMCIIHIASVIRSPVEGDYAGDILN